jgi:glycosyltransferase involved in cell wall biosynthesis
MVMDHEPIFPAHFLAWFDGFESEVQEHGAIFAMKIMAISILDLSLNSEGRNGGSLYAASLIDSLAEICDVETCVLDHASKHKLPGRWNVKRFPASPIGSLFLRQVFSMRRGIKTAVWRHHSVALAQYLSGLEEGHFDAVLFLEESACIFERYVPKGIPKILFRHNLDSQSTKIDFGSPVRLVRSVMTRTLSRRFDRWTNRRFSAITIGTESERRILETLGGRGKISWLPTISRHDIPEYAAAMPDVDPSGKFRAIFVGDFRYGPNVDAVNWLLGCERYFEKATLKVLEIVLVGRNPPDLKAPSALHISRLGFVSDLMQVFGSCEIGVIPIISGSGVKIKALTLLGSGMPVVTTPEGVEGLGVRDGIHCIIARTQKDFAAAVEKLHRDERLRERLKSEARAFILTNFSKTRQVEALRLLLNRFDRKPVECRA